MNKTPTAQEFFRTHYKGDIANFAVEFAKLHIEEQKQAISHEMDLTMPNGGYDCGAQDAVKNAYPATNIK